MGRYVPPDQEGVLGANQASGKGHALGARASKLKTEGILTVRFEMPFAVWCDHCAPPQLIGQGVRFNAEKKKVGAYYSSAVYSFRMRHAACGGVVEVRTDPRNTAYVVVEGGRRRDTGEEEGEGDSLVASGDALVRQMRTTTRQTAEERETAFANLEKTIEDRAALAAATARIDELGGVADRQWDDPYARNQALRRTFRAGRKKREEDAGVTEGLRDRMGLGIELLPESEEDVRRAALVDFGRRPADGEGEERVLARPLFGGDGKKVDGGVVGEKSGAATGKGKTPRRLKSEMAAIRMRESLVSEIVGNTRLAKDPFLEPRGKDTKSSAAFLPGLKRKRAREKEPNPSPDEERPAEKIAAVSALVDYDSD